MQAIQDADRIVIHNSRFDRTVLAYNNVNIPVSKIDDTMAWARAHGLPGALASLCSVLNVPTDKQKDNRGKQLIRLFCVPREAGRATKETHPAQWQEFREYAALDVVAMREVYKMLPRWNTTGFERQLWELDQKINDRGFAVDTRLVKGAIAAVEREQKRNKARVHEMTNGDVNAVTERDRMLKHLLEQYGVELPDFKKSTLERRADDPDLPAPVRELIALRLEGATTSTSKYKKLLGCLSVDNRLRGSLEYCGAARTGRWSGRLFQPQNLPRVKHSREEIDESVDAAHADTLDLLFPDAIARASSCLRSVIVPGSKATLHWADLANIEGRIAAWVAGEEWKLEAFRAYDAGTGPDLYLVTAGGILGKRPEDVTKDERQSSGKVPELACNYQGAVGAFASMAQLYGLELPEHRVLEIVKAWRRKNPNIVAFWRQIERTAIDVVLGINNATTINNVTVRKDGNWLRIVLPSGRSLCYPSPRVVEGKLTYMGINQYSLKWERLKTYGGKLFENIVQAIARDVVAQGIVRADQQGFRVVLSVHDEIIAELPDGEEPGVGLADLLTAGALWMEGLPLAAEGESGNRYGK